MRISEFVERCDAAPEPEGVFRVFRDSLEELGYDQIAFTPVTAAARRVMGLADLAPALAVNVPERWVRHYFSNKYQNFDPVLLRTPHEDAPLIWERLLEGPPLSPKQRRVLVESREAGIYNGASVPLHGPNGETYVVSLASSDPAIDGTPNLPKLQMLSVQFLLS
jgi:hypothetical protein